MNTRQRQSSEDQKEGGFLLRLLFLAVLLLTSGKLHAQSFLEWKGLKPGPHAVGFQSRIVEDPARTFGLPKDYLGRPRPDFRHRPLQIALWYPASAQNSGTPMAWGDYLPLMAWTGPAKAAEEDLHLQQTLTPGATPPIPERMEHLRGETVWARRDASPGPGRFPVLVYAPGGGYPASDNSVLCEYLASHGYVVIATPPIGNDQRPLGYNLLDLEAGTRDLEFLIGYVRNLPQADPDRMAVMGFSWGGIVSGLVAMRNADIKALVSLDSNLRDSRALLVAKGLPGFEPGRLQVPVLCIQPVPERATPHFQDDSILDQAPRAELTRVSFLHAAHHDFASFSSLLQRCAEPGKVKDFSRITASYEFLCRTLLGFLDTHLLGRPPRMETDESLAQVSLRAAREAPPSIQDFQGILRSDGPEKALDLLRTVQRSTPGALATFEPAINQAGYEALGRGNTSEALELFRFNTKCFPDSWNAWDSLGEAYVNLQHQEEAEHCYRAARAKLEQDATVPAARKTEQLKRIDGLLVQFQKPAEKGWSLWHSARASEKKGDKAEAIKSLQRLMDLHTGYNPGNDPGALNCLKGELGFEELLQRAEKEFPIQVHSLEAFVVSDRNLVPEGLAFDPVGRSFYMGSLAGAKIYRITMDGTVTDFATGDGLGEVVGLRVDAKHRILWAGNQSPTETGVFGFDLASGNLLRKAGIPKAGHFFNDLAVSPQGDVYVTDSDGHKIYRLRPDGTALEDLDIPVKGPNGIALTADGKTMFISDMSTGILRVDVATLQSAPLERPGNLSLLGIDGLYTEGQTLLAVHNWYTSTQVIRYHMDASLSQVLRVEVLERRDPSWKLPTTGAIAEGWFYFMANTQVDRYDGKGNTITPGPPLEPIRILKTKL